MPLCTRRTERTLAIRLQNDPRYSTRDRYEIDLASAKLLSTTSLRLASLMRALRCGESQPWRKMSDLALANADAGSCDEIEYGGAVHSRFAVEEIDLICNHKFV
jgi:hypothetical protein